MAVRKHTIRHRVGATGAGKSTPVQFLPGAARVSASAGSGAPQRPRPDAMGRELHLTQKASRVFHALPSRSLPLPDVQDLPLGVQVLRSSGQNPCKYPSGIHPAG